MTGNQVEVWNTATLKLQYKLPSAATGDRASISISSDGHVLSLCGNSGSAGVLELWNLPLGSRIKSISSMDTPYLSSATISPDDKSLGVTTEAGSVQIWDLDSGKMTATWDTQISESDSAIAYSGDGQSICVVGVNFAPNLKTFSPLEFWNARTHKLIRRLYTDSTRFLWSSTFSPKGDLIACSTESVNDGTFTSGVQIWDVASGKSRAQLRTQANQNESSIRFSPDGGKIAVAGASSLSPGQTSPVLELWDVSSDQRVKRLDIGSSDSVISLAFSPDGTMLLAGTKYGNGNGMFRFYDAMTGGVKSSFALPTWASPGPLSFTSDGKTLMVDLVNGLWRYDLAAQTLTQSASISAASGQSYTFSSEGWLFAQGSTDQVFGVGDVSRVRIWNTSSGYMREVPGNAPFGVGPVTGFTPDSQYLLTTLGSELDAYSLSDGSTQGFATWKLGLLRSIDSSPSGDLIAFGGIGRQGLAIAPNPLFGLTSLSGIAIHPSTVIGGSVVSGTVTLSQPAPKVGVIVTLACNSGNATLPASVLIAYGKSSATFTIKTKHVTTAAQVTVTANMGNQNRSSTFRIL